MSPQSRGDLLSVLRVAVDLLLPDIWGAVVLEGVRLSVSVGGYKNAEIS